MACNPLKNAVWTGQQRSRDTIRNEGYFYNNATLQLES
jgi:hypothetical protein